MSAAIDVRFYSRRRSKTHPNPIDVISPRYTHDKRRRLGRHEFRLKNRGATGREEVAGPVVREHNGGEPVPFSGVRGIPDEAANNQSMPVALVIQLEQLERRVRKLRRFDL